MLYDGGKVQDTKFRIMKRRCFMMEERYRIRNTGYKIQDNEKKMLYNGGKIQDTKYRIMKRRCCIMEVRYRIQNTR